MDRIERIKIVGEELNSAIDRIRFEYDVTLAEMMGILEIAKLNLFDEAREREEDE